jgi:hypothetical protein
VARWKPGQSGNPGGRKSYPPEIKLDLKITGMESYRRIKAVAENLELASDHKTLPYFLAANIRLFEAAYGKSAEPPGLEDEPIESTGTPVERVQPTPKQIAGVLQVLARMGRLPVPGGIGSPDGGADAATDGLHSAPAAPDTGGVPPP